MTNRNFISTSDGAAAIGPYSQAIKIGDLIVVAGQIALDPSTTRIIEGGVEEHTERVIRNIETILGAAGARLDQVVRCVVYLTTMEHYAAMNEVYGRFFGDCKPVRTTVAVTGLPAGSLVEIEATAIV